MKMIKAEIYHVLNSFIDFFFPRFCICCHSRLSISEHHICGICMLKLPRIPISSFEDNEMARRFWGLIPIERCASLFYYAKDSTYSRILMKLKYGNRPEVGDFMGRVLAEELFRKNFFNNIDLIIPIPLTKEKEKQRGYNQSEWIAKGISNITNIPINKSCIIRTISAKSQTTLNSQQRMESVQGVFMIINPNDIIGKHILLIDDVMTTGATLLSCAETIAKVPHTKISIVTLARTHL